MSATTTVRDVTEGFARVRVGIRTHRFGEAEKELHAFLVRHFAPEHVFVVVDETRGPVAVPRPYRKIGFDRPTLKRMALFHDAGRIGWLCGDYFHYVMHERLAADAYWLIEPDMRFTFADPGAFFRPFEASNADVLACGFGRRKRVWTWYRQVAQLAPEVYGCFFPITRLSATAIERLLPLRQELSRALAASGGGATKYANDEAFVATAAMKLGLRCEDMRAIQPEALAYVSTGFPFLWPQARAVLPADRAVHPALEAAAFWPAFERHVKNAVGDSPTLWDFTFAATVGADDEHRRKVRAALQACMGVWFDFFFDPALRKAKNRPPWDRDG